jgi:excinuclease ABC subunit C
MLEKIKSLPDSPGIYQYYDDKGKLLYIGKAKSLKKRVKNYFSFTPSLRPNPKADGRILKMLNETTALDYILVDSDADALILENSLIKQLKPKYNILLRDDKTYPYIYIDLNDDFPRFEITRSVRKGNRIKYFGPFVSGARDIVDALYEIYPLVQKKSCVKGKKACLYYQIERCLAPCEGKITQEEYAKIVADAQKTIHNKEEILDFLTNKMSIAAERLLFEEAGLLRDKIERVKKTQTITRIDLAKLEDFDIIAHALDATRICIVRLFIRDGKVVSTSSNIIKSDYEIDINEIYVRSLISLYPETAPMPIKTLYTMIDFDAHGEMAALLSKRFDKKITISTPKIGEKRKLIDIAARNAKELLSIDAKSNTNALLQEIKELFNLAQTPYRAEAYDNSHISATAIVGALVAWEDGWYKEGYRHYNLSHKDDYAQMKEMLSRRCESFETNPPPNLWVIDGGEALRRLAVDIAESFGVAIDVVAIAKEKVDARANRSKGKANDILYTKNGEFKLNTNDPRLHFFQNLRDEAHRYALTFHRKQKNRQDQQIALLRADGIGEGSVKKLLDYFGTFEAIENASRQELETVIGKRGNNVYAFYHKE